MSERILKALMQLFAIIARPDSDLNERKEVVKNFLRQQLSSNQVNEYLQVFEKFYHQYVVNEVDTTKKRKKIAGSSVKVLKICTSINEELTVKQKIIVLIRLLEFIKSDTQQVSDLELEFVETVSEIFNIPHEEFLNLKRFVLNSPEDVFDNPRLLIIDSDINFSYGQVKHIYNQGFNGRAWVLNVKYADLFFLKLQTPSEVYINSQLVQPYKVYTISPGSVIKTSKKFKPIYYFDIVSIFKEREEESKIILEVKDIEYKFKGGQIGLHKMSFTAESGMLVGIIGASGAGKTTLLNVLNGTYKPDKGEVLINGKSIHDPANKELEGLIGYVSQDDLLIEDLTVFENLYFNAKLCFGNLNEFQILRLVLKTLQNLGLYEIRHLKVGSVLNKKISGGQRKRLNIALELIREPPILFLDEPTSGLSSRDSENIMDLLKDLSLKGKLVIVVIHQPSSDIYKMFDKLLVLDQGGYLVYDGNPVEAIMYFKSKTQQANWEESECPTCGNVNPEQIFNILETPVLDEYGNPTLTRKISPIEWHNYFVEEKQLKEQKTEERIDYTKYKLPKILFKIPNKFKQLKIFTIRDALAKLSNIQYLILNLLETPLLAFILSFIIRYYNVDTANEWGYTFADNPNIPVYYFIASIIAIFVGLTVSAEEIFKDKKILKREKFLNLSWGSYLSSKCIILSIISAYQALTFVLIGNTILEVKGMYFHFWLILFATWVTSNIMGLIISEAFNSAVTIYITIPFIVIPQLILSGIVVSYDKLNPDISSPSRIPIYGQLITARWTYEALATYQFINNDYEKLFYKYDKITSFANFRKDFWARHLQNKIIDIRIYKNNPEKKEYIENSLVLLKNELSEEMERNKYVKSDINLNDLKYENLNDELLNKIDNYLNNVIRVYIKIFNAASSKKDLLINKFQETKEKRDEFIRLKKKCFNEKLKEFVRNETEINKIVEYKNRLYQKADLIFLDPPQGPFNAHFYSPFKNLYGLHISTYWFNLLIIILMGIIFYFTVYFKLLSKIISFSELASFYVKKFFLKLNLKKKK